MPLSGTTQLPIAPRNHRWNPVAAKARVLESCGGNVACIARAFLWRDPDHDARKPEAWSLQIADYIDGQLHIVPKALAACAGLRGIGTMTFSCDEDSQLVVERLGEVYEAVRKVYDDWPRSPFYVAPEPPITALKADASGQGIEGVIAVEGVETGDGRLIEVGALTWEELPVPLVFDREEMDHTGATVGTINAIERREEGVLWATGNLSESEDPDTQMMVSRVAELFSEGAVGVSVSLDNITEEEGEVLTVTSGRIRSVAIVDEAAFAPAKMALAASVNAQAEWFSDPKFSGEDDPRLVWQDGERAEEEGQYGCPLTVTDDGQVYGHIALWGRCHVGYPGTCVRPPREPAAYRNFMSGERIPGIPTGPLVMRTGHAPTGADVTAEAARVHYDHTGYAVADVSIGPDEYGIWCAGALRPGVSPEDIEILRASALSGDWRLIGGQHRLIGVLVCSAPGFRIARAIAASGVLITSGPGCQVCDDVPLEERVAKLEMLVQSLQVSA